MKILIDTHILLWWLADSPRLRPVARQRLADRDSEIFVSVVSLWEIAIKARVGKLEADIEAILRDIEREGFIRLPIAELHLIALTTLECLHRDPFDHMLVAQAIAEDVTFLSADAVMAHYPVRLLPA